MSEWKMGDWAVSLNRRCRFVSTLKVDGTTYKYFVFESGHILHSSDAVPLPCCDSWDWRPDPKYRPFANAAEFLKAWRERKYCPLVSSSGSVLAATIVGGDGGDDSPIYANGWKSFERLLEFKFDIDSSSCGVEVTE